MSTISIHINKLIAYLEYPRYAPASVCLLTI